MVGRLSRHAAQEEATCHAISRQRERITPPHLRCRAGRWRILRDVRGSLCAWTTTAPSPKLRPPLRERDRSREYAPASSESPHRNRHASRSYRAAVSRKSNGCSESIPEFCFREFTVSNSQTQ